MIDSFYCPEVSLFSYYTGIVDALAGLLGLILYMIACPGLQIVLLLDGTVPPASLNLQASFHVPISLWRELNLPSAIIQIIWLAICMFGLSGVCRLCRTSRLSPVEGQHLGRDTYFELFPEQALSREAQQNLLASNGRARASAPLPPGT